jgi:multidrug efflux pump subunit AcrA (membrane-fusion protein)
LVGCKVPSKAELDAARATLARAIADNRIARANISDANAALSTDQINFSNASIAAPSDGSTITDNVVTYLTYLDVNNADLSLRPGMSATASIVAAER